MSPGAMSASFATTGSAEGPSTRKYSGQPIGAYKTGKRGPEALLSVRGDYGRSVWSPLHAHLRQDEILS